jgi:hypothetical protein
LPRGVAKAKSDKLIGETENEPGPDGPLAAGSVDELSPSLQAKKSPASIATVTMLKDPRLIALAVMAPLLSMDCHSNTI